MEYAEIDYQPTQENFARDISKISGQPLTACYGCRRCAAGCPVASETGEFTPDKLIRSILYGDRETAFNNPLIWRCVSCFICGARCPNNIHTSKIIDTMKQLQYEQKTTPLYSKVAQFHEEFFKAALRTGRLNEIDFLLRYESKQILNLMGNKRFKQVGNELKQQIKFGNALRRKKRLGLHLHTSRGRKELKKVYSQGKTE